MVEPINCKFGQGFNKQPNYDIFMFNSQDMSFRIEGFDMFIFRKFPISWEFRKKIIGPEGSGWYATNYNRPVVVA